MPSPELGPLIYRFCALSHYLHPGSNLCSPCSPGHVTYKLLQAECVSCEDLPDVAANTPIAFAAAIKYCADSSQIDNLLDTVSKMAGRDGIGIYPVIGTTKGAETVEDDEPVIVLSRDVEWLIAFICIFGLTLGITFMLYKRCIKKDAGER